MLPAELLHQVPVFPPGLHEARAVAPGEPLLKVEGGALDILRGLQQVFP